MEDAVNTQPRLMLHSGYVYSPAIISLYPSIENAKID